MLLITIGLTILAIAIACSLLKFATLKEPGLSEPRYVQLMIGVQIICGDCSGDAERPIKTYVDRSGNCAQCGGRSFVLASNVMAYEHRMMIACLSGQETLAFKPPKDTHTFTAAASVN